MGERNGNEAGRVGGAGAVGHGVASGVRVGAALWGEEYDDGSAGGGGLLHQEQFIEENDFITVGLGRVARRVKVEPR